jgi:hypothetical protein
MLSQLRAGGIELLAAPSMTPSTLVPLSGLPSVGFAFQSYDRVWAALGGAVGDIVRDAIAKTGIVPIRKKWDLRLSSDHLVLEPAAQQRRGSEGFQDPRAGDRAPSLFSGLGALPSEHQL